MYIFLARNREQAGPYTLEQLNSMLQQGQVELDDLMWHEGMTEWLPVGRMTYGRRYYQPSPTHTCQPVVPQTVKEHPEKSTGYQATTQTLVFQLATPMSRISAKAVDMMFWLPVSLIPMFFLNNQDIATLNSLSGSYEKVVQNQRQILELLPDGALFAMTIYVIGMLALQASLIRLSGQSIGKRLMNIRIVDATTGQLGSVWRSFMLRSVLFILLFNMLGLLAAPILIADLALLFSQRRQTLHDRVARTVVITSAVAEIERPVSGSL